jgi:S-disulfanyl-L-cysteine oxidoreductase SoxD
MQPRRHENTKKTVNRNVEPSRLRGCIFVALLLTATGGISQERSTRSVWQGVFSAAQSERGAAVYKQSCGTCHGETLAGDIGPTLTGPFWSIWEGRTAADLLKTIRTTMPADAPESLKPQEYADVVAYLFSVNKFPAGEKELPVDQAALESIKISKQ